MFVSPSNPTGAVYPVEEVEAIGRWAAERGIWVVTDEIYEHLTYGDHRFSSMPTLVPELRDRCVVLNGVAKTYAMTGWRVGWMIGPTDIIKAATNLQSHATSNVANVSQRAAIAALTGDLDRGGRDARRLRPAGPDHAQAAHRHRGGHVHRAAGRLLRLPQPRAPTWRTIRGRTATTTTELAAILLDEAKVAIVPGEAFGAPGYARRRFALGDDDLGEGVSASPTSSAEAS